MTDIKRNVFSGTNNVAHPERLPEGFARAIVNMDVHDGRLALREGLKRIYEGTDPRSILSLGNKLLIADGSDLVEFNTDTKQARILRSIPATGQMAGDTYAGQLYFCLENQCLRYDGSAVLRWGVEDSNNNFSVANTTGDLPDGYYRIAVTFMDQSGLEGGTARPRVMRISGGAQITVGYIPDGHKACIYMSAPGGETLYRRAILSMAGSYQVTTNKTHGAQLVTSNRYAPVAGSIVCAHQAMLCIARDNHVSMTMPMSPHLVDRVAGMLQFPGKVGDMASSGQLYVSADKLYSVSGIGTAEMRQSAVLDYPAIPGASASLPDGSAVMITEKGAVRLAPDDVQLMTHGVFVPGPSAKGVTGVIDSRGATRTITSTRAAPGRNRLLANDRFTGEVRIP